MKKPIYKRFTCNDCDNSGSATWVSTHECTPKAADTSRWLEILARRDAKLDYYGD